MKSTKTHGLINFLATLTLICISFCFSTAQDLIINNIQYLDVHKGQIERANILIEDGVIQSIGQDPIHKPDLRVLDGGEKYLAPGLFDTHIHLFQSGGLYTRPDVIDLRDIRSYKNERQWLQNHAPDLLQRYLRCGITTVIDVGGPFANFDIRDRYKESPSHSNLVLTGPLISTYQPQEFGEEDPPIIRVRSSDEAREMVQNQLPYQPDFIKIWYIVMPQQSAESSYDIIKAAIDESHKHKLKVAVHATQLNTAKLAVKAGADILVHSVDDKIDEDFISLLRNNKVAYIPTLNVHGNYIRTLTDNYVLSREDFDYAHPVPIGSMTDISHLDISGDLEYYINEAPRLRSELQNDVVRRLENLRTLSAANIQICTGTDAGNIGTHHASSYFHELEEMASSMTSPAQLWRASTIHAATAFGLEKKYGSIEVGKIADLILLNTNPIDDIQSIQGLTHVIKSGHLIDVDTLIVQTPELLAQRQLNAYNSGNIDEFIECYSDSVRVYQFPNNLIYSGKENMRKSYDQMFKNTPDLHCELVNRIIQDNVVIDRERVTGFGEGRVIDATAIYKIEHGKIQEVYFIQ